MMWKFVVAVLATWRVTHLLAKEDGPADIIYRFRFRLGQSFAGKLMDCFNCMSLWVAAPVALFVSTRIAECCVSWLALSGAACLLEKLIHERVMDSLPGPSEGDLNHVLWAESRTTNGSPGAQTDPDTEFEKKPC